MRNLRIFIDCEKEAGPMERALGVVVEMLTSAEVVDDFRIADLIIISDLRRLAKIYNSDTQYAFINVSRQQFTVDKPNVNEISISDCVPKLMEIASKIVVKDDDESTVTELEVTPTACIEKPDTRWILVVDDKPENQASARQQLDQDFNLVVATGFDEARKALKDRKFDYALLDLHMPVATEGALASEALAKNLGQEIPYGLFLLLEACQKGAHAALVTDLNHHQDPFSAAFDYYRGQPMTINGEKALMLHAHMIDGAKNWRWALDQLLK